MELQESCRGSLQILNDIVVFDSLRKSLNNKQTQSWVDVDLALSHLLKNRQAMVKD